MKLGSLQNPKYVIKIAKCIEISSWGLKIYTL